MAYNCNCDCKICKKAIISTAVTIVTVDGVDTLVIDLPSPTVVGATPYLNGVKYCVVVTQPIPTTATVAMPVAFSIGGDTTTVYPFTNCDCSQVTACGVKTRTRYPVLISTTAVCGVFKSLRKISCYPTGVLSSLPVATATTAAANEQPVVLTTRTITAKTTKGGTVNE